jgi:hypothetical protein
MRRLESAAMPSAAALSAFGRGTALAALAASASWAIAALGFRRDYYLAALLPLCMAALVLVSWLSYLGDDGLARRRSRPERGEPGPEGGAASAGRALRAILLVAACELGLAAAALYSFAGIGASFFR